MNKYDERSRMYTLDNDNTVIDKHTVGQVTNCLEKHERTRRKSRVPEDKTTKPIIGPGEFVKSQVQRVASPGPLDVYKVSAVH